MRLIHNYDSFKQLLNTEPFIIHNYDTLKQVLNTEPYLYINDYDLILFEKYVIEIMGLGDEKNVLFNIYSENHSKYFNISRNNINEINDLVQKNCLLNIKEDFNLDDIPEARILLESLVRKRKLERLLC